MIDTQSPGEHLEPLVLDLSAELRQRYADRPAVEAAAIIHAAAIHATCELLGPEAAFRAARMGTDAAEAALSEG